MAPAKCRRRSRSRPRREPLGLTVLMTDVGRERARRCPKKPRPPCSPRRSPRRSPCRSPCSPRRSPRRSPCRSPCSPRRSPCRSPRRSPPPPPPPPPPQPCVQPRPSTTACTKRRRKRVKRCRRRRRSRRHRAPVCSTRRRGGASNMVPFGEASGAVLLAFCPRLRSGRPEGRVGWALVSPDLLERMVESSAQFATRVAEAVWSALRGQCHWASGDRQATRFLLPSGHIMKTSVELAINGIQALQLQHKGRSGYRVKSSTSFVDETLFGKPSGARPTPPKFDPPWAVRARSGKLVPLTPNSEGAKWNLNSDPSKSSSSTPPHTPRKKNKYRLIRHTPSYCDETLFSSRQEEPTWEAPWMKKEDATKLQPLLWSPPSAPWAIRSPRPKETPLRAIHPEPKTRNKPDIWQRLSDGLDSPGFLKRGQSQSLTHLNASPGGYSLGTSPPHQRGQQQAWTQAAVGTFQSPVVTPRAHAISLSEPATPRKRVATPKPKPPWK